MIAFVPWRLGHSNLAIDALTALELTGDLELCLDPGDPNSYGGSGQTWADVSGNGHDVFRGASSSSEGSDPTFNGSPGDLDAYWSFDGGDYFTLAAANPAFVESLHQDGAVFTWIGWFYIVNDGTGNGLLGTAGFGSGRIGVEWFHFGANGTLRFTVDNGGSPPPILNVDSTDDYLTYDTWQCIGFSFDEASGDGFFFNNGVVETFTGQTYSSPSASNGTHPLTLGTRGGANAPLADGSRYGPLVMLSEALSVAQVNAYFNATRGRFNV